MRRVAVCARLAFAFTLVELLVSISIIAVLAALLFPVFAAARSKSQGAPCLSNLRQCGTAIALYCADYDDYLPFAPDALERHADAGSNNFPPDDVLDQLRATLPYDVTYLLHAYGTIPEVFHCPLDRNWMPNTEPGHKPTFFAECGSSYWYDDRHALLGRTLTGYPAPAENIVMQEYYYYHGGTTVEDGWENVLFADLHVKLTAAPSINEMMDKDP